MIMIVNERHQVLQSMDLENHSKDKSKRIIYVSNLLSQLGEMK